MTDVSAPISSRPLTGQEYLEQLRQRRLEKHEAPMNTPPVEPIATTPTPEPYTPVEPTPVEEVPKTPSHSLADKLPDMPKPVPEEVVLAWRAASRPFKKRDRQYYTTIAVIVFLISLILFFAGQFLPIAVVVSVGFLSYVLSSVPPDLVEHQVTTYGIRVENTLYYWEEMGRFWFEEKFNQPIIHIEIARFPGRLTMVLGDLTPAEMKELLSQVLLEEQPKPTLYDKMARWLQDKIPLEITGK